MTCTCKLCMAVPPEQRPVHKTEADLAPRLEIGQRVEKYTGEARWFGTIVTDYTTTRGKLRYVVEVEPQGFQMIAVPSQLRPALEADLVAQLDNDALAAANDQMRRDNYAGIPVKHWPERIVRAYLAALRARPPEGERALETVNAVREAFTTQTNSAAPDFDSGYLTALDEIEQALRKAKPSQHAHIADALEYLARREAELKARPPAGKVEELIKRLRASADPSWEQQISHIETKAAKGVPSNEGVSEWDIKGWMLVLRGLLSDNIEAADTLERLSRRERELEAERDRCLALYCDWKALAERHHADGQKHWERATAAEARVAKLEAELAGFEPDLLPDDPKVARLTVHNSVWEWMRVGYRLHHAGRVGEQLAAVKTKRDTALEVLERLLEIVSPPTPGSAGEDSINERIRAAHDFLRSAKKGE